MVRFDNLTLKYAYVHFVPMVMEYFDGKQKRIWGQVGSVLTNITASMGINYVLISPPDGIQGGPKGNGTYDGTMGLIKRAEADIASGPFPLTGDLHKNFKTFMPHQFVDLVIIGGFHQEYESHPGFGLLEFMPEVWICYAFSLLIVAGLATVARKIWMERIKNKSIQSYSDHFWALVEITLQKGSTSELQTDPLRYTYIAWALGTFLLMTYFTSWVHASSAIKTPTPRIKNVEDLVKHEKMIPYILKGCSLLAEFIAAPLPHYRKLYHMVKNNHGERLPSEQYDQHNLENVIDRKGVLITDVPCLESHAKQCFDLNGYFYVAEERIAQMQFSWAARDDIDPAIINEINRRVRWVVDAGVPFMRSFDINPTTEDCILLEDAKQAMFFEPLYLFDVVSCFYVHLFFCGVAICILITECFAAKITNRFDRLRSAVLNEDKKVIDKNKLNNEWINRIR